MAGLTGSYASITFDQNAASNYVRGRLREILRLGITAWVEEAKSIIPVWSGASRASLTQVAGLVGVAVFGPGKGSTVAHSNEPVPGVKNRVGLGQSSESFEVNDSGEGGRFSFRWKSDLFHLNVNERTNVNALSHRFHLIQPGPYELRRHCNDAFKRTVDAELARFQFRIRQFIRTRRIKIGG